MMTCNTTTTDNSNFIYLGILYSYMVLVANTGGMLRMAYTVPNEFEGSKEQEITEMIERLQTLLSKHKLTKEEFAVLYGYTYLAKQDFMKVDDIRFILSQIEKHA